MIIKLSKAEAEHKISKKEKLKENIQMENRIKFYQKILTEEDKKNFELIQENGDLVLKSNRNLINYSHANNPILLLNIKKEYFFNSCKKIKTKIRLLLPLSKYNK